MVSATNAGKKFLSKFLSEAINLPFETHRAEADHADEAE
jgi:hypothetical protein